MSKNAVLIAMAHEEPFEKIKQEIYPTLVKWYALFGYDTFFVYGRTPLAFERKFRRNIEKLRWNRYYPLLRAYDLLFLRIYKWYKPRVQISGQQIFVNVPEDLRHLSVKILASLSLLRSLGYQLIIRTTINSILMPGIIDKELNKHKSKVLLYGGRENQQEDGFTFISGSLTIFNAECIDLLASKIKFFDFSLIDDVAIGKLLTMDRITSLKLKTLDIVDLEDLGEIVSNSNFAQIRCKSTKPSGERIDFRLMLESMKILGIE